MKAFIVEQQPDHCDYTDCYHFATHFVYKDDAEKLVDKTQIGYFCYKHHLLYVLEILEID